MSVRSYHLCWLVILSANERPRPPPAPKARLTLLLSGLALNHSAVWRIMSFVASSTLEGAACDSATAAPSPTSATPPTSPLPLPFAPTLAASDDVDVASPAGVIAAEAPVDNVDTSFESSA